MNSLLIRNATLPLAGQDSPPRVDIVVAGQTIAAIEEAGSGSTSGDYAEVVDLGGAAVIPGLIDMHVHLVWSGEADPASAVERNGEQATAMRAAQNAQQSLRAGVTTVRDLGGGWEIPLTLARLVEEGAIPGPEIIATGKSIIMTGGHDPFWGVPADGPSAGVAAVRQRVALGARVVKVAATGGAYGRAHGEDVGQSELTREELAAITAEAHRLGLRVAAHAVGREGIANAVHAGIDTIEHGILVDDETISAMAQLGTVLCPTLHTYRTLANGGSIGIPQYAVDKAGRLTDIHRTAFVRAREAGVRVVAGTDAGAPGLSHPALVHELLVMREYGMSTRECLAAATETAAVALGLDQQIGRVAPGMRADLVALDGDPLEDLRWLYHPRLVVTRGRTTPSRPDRWAADRADHLGARHE